MAIKHAAFLSYCHGQGELMRRFVIDVHEALTSSLEPYMAEPVFLDQERLRPGYQFNEQLATAICESLCLVAVVVPRYFESGYCLQELEAMKRLEQRRFSAMGPTAPASGGLIVPIVLRGSLPDLPAALREHPHLADFTTFSTADRQLAKSRRFAQKIDSIAAFIADLKKGSLHHEDAFGHPCADFRLPSEAESEEWRSRPARMDSFILRNPGR